MLCCSAPPACSSTPLRPSVHYPSISLLVNIVYFQTFCEHLCALYFRLESYRVEVKLELYGANSRLVLHCLRLKAPKPPPSRWPALTLPLAKLQLVWRRLCEALLSSSPPAGEKHPSPLSHLLNSLKCRKHKGSAVNTNIKSSSIFADTVDALTATCAV